MKKIRIIPLILTLCLLFGAFAPAASALDEPSLHSAKAVVLADLDSGRLLYSKNADEQRSPASLTKIMTVLLAVEALERGEVTLEEMVTAQSDCLEGLNTDSSTSGIQPGEVMRYQDLLYCAMVHSANEACNCTNTHFADPNGLSNENHYTTAYEMYLITREAINHPLFAEICNTRGYDMPATNVSQARSFANSNALISADSEYGSSYLYPAAAGVKTGFTQRAGYCLVSTAEKDGVHLLAVVMGCDGWLNAGIDEYENFSDTIALYNWAFDNFAYRQAVSATNVVTRVQVELAADADSGVNLRPQNDVTLLLPKDLDLEKLELQTTVFDDMLVAPIGAGTVLGRAEIVIDGVDYGRVNLVNAAEVELSRKEFMNRQVHETVARPWFVVLLVFIVLLAGGYLVLVLRYRAQRRKYLRRKRELAARRAARERSADPPLPVESTQRFAAYIDEEMEKRKRN